MTVQLQKRLFTVTEYHQMVQSGILTEDDRVELIEGEIVAMSPIGSRHAACVNRLNRIFSQQAGERVVISVQNPIRVGEHSEPEPDLTLLQPRPDFYAQAHPEPKDVLLVIEVAETTLDYDREVKIPLYARAGLVEVWLVNLADEQIEVYRQPSVQGYGLTQRFWRGQRVLAQMLPEAEIDVDAVLG